MGLRMGYLVQKGPKHVVWILSNHQRTFGRSNQPSSDDCMVNQLESDDCSAGNWRTSDGCKVNQLASDDCFEGTEEVQLCRHGIVSG
jgi:hypothetical protein